MTTFLLLAALNCPKPDLVIWEPPWEWIDQQNFQAAQKRCGQKYPNSPCLKKFEKRGERSYWVICGPEKKRINKRL